MNKRDLWDERMDALEKAIRVSALKHKYKKELREEIVKFCIDNGTLDWIVFTKERERMTHDFLRTMWIRLEESAKFDHLTVGGIFSPRHYEPPCELRDAVPNGMNLMWLNVAEVDTQTGIHPIITFYSTHPNRPLWNWRLDHNDPLGATALNWVRSHAWAEIANHDGGPCGTSRYVLKVLD